MVKIHGLVYLVVGIGVVLYSYYINLEKLMFFTYIGLVMIIFGVGKLVFGFITKEKKPKQAKVKQGQAMQDTQKSSGFCSFCGSRINTYGQFCPFCGGRVR